MIVIWELLAARRTAPGAGWPAAQHGKLIATRSYAMAACPPGMLLAPGLPQNPGALCGSDPQEGKAVISTGTAWWHAGDRSCHFRKALGNFTPAELSRSGSRAASDSLPRVHESTPPCTYMYVYVSSNPSFCFWRSFPTLHLLTGSLALLTCRVIEVQQPRRERQNAARRRRHRRGKWRCQQVLQGVQQRAQLPKRRV